MSINKSESLVDISHQIPKAGHYHFKNKFGRRIEVNSDEIFLALEEQASKDELPEPGLNEDLYGWSLINATDENGKSRPFCIMRSLPLSDHIPFHEVQEDDHEMAGILLEEIYNLTQRRIKWIRFKTNIKQYLIKLFSKK